MRRKTMCWPTGAARVIAPLVLLLLLCLAPAYSYGATIFTEGFETGAPGTTGWATSGTVNWYTGTPKNGTHSVQLGRNGTLQRTISTQGYDTIAVSFYLGASFASSNQSVRVRYTTNGFTWTTLVTLTTTTAWASYGPYSLPASAADNDNFALRCEAASSSGANYGYIDDVLVTGNPKSYALNLTGTGGTVNVNGVNYALPWSGTFIYGTAVTLQAVPNAHYQFSSWSGDLRSHSNPTTVTINQQYDITVNFQIQQCTLSIPNATGGSVSVNGRSQRLPYQDTFDYGSSITLQATANSGYAFSGWTGDLTSSANPVTITITDDMSITANFTVVPTTLTISGSHGSVQVNGGAASPLPWSGGFAYGTRVTVVAVPDVGYHFVQWTGDASGTRTTVRIRMLGDRNVTAVFAPNQYQLSLSGSGGQVSVNGTPQTLPWSGMFDYGTTVTLTALPTPPGQFTGWSGDLTGTANPASVLIDGAKNITAGFTTPQYQLSLTGSNGGVKVNGTLQALPWSGSFSAGTVVTLEAVANTHYHFTGWSGDLTGTTSPTSITMDGAKNITAGFAIDQFQLSLTIGSHGGVKVNGTLQTGSYTGTFDYGTVVTLEAVSNAHCHFTGWSGDLTGTTSPTSITMDGTKNITAGFAFDQFQLSLTIGSHGGVKVNGTLQTGSYTGTFDYSSVVTLEAVPNAHYHFTGWSGDLTGTTSPTSITIDGAKNITASFAIDQHKLNLTGAQGTVEVNGGAPQTLPWTGTFDYGSVVALQAVPDAHYHFVDWSGDLIATANPTSITMNVDRDENVTVDFKIDQYQLSLTGSNGTVEVNGGAAQTLPWSGMIDYGTLVTLQAVPNAHYHFTGWSGDLTGTTNPASIASMDSAKTIAVGFAIDRFALNLTGPSTFGSVKVNGAPQTLPWSATYDYDTLVTLEAVPNQYRSFTGWSGDLTGTTNPTSITMDSAKTITVGFGIEQMLLTVSGLSGSVLVNDTTVQALPWTGSFDYGSNVTLQPLPDSCDRFDGWTSGSSAPDFTSPLSLTMDENRAITANFSSLEIFSDVSCDFWAVHEIVACVKENVVVGYPDGTYRPAVTVSRDQMAVYISRALAGGDENVPTGPATATFPDVDVDYWAFKYIEYAFANSIVVGYPNGTYQPTVPVTRDQMAVFIARAIVTPTGDAGLKSYVPPTHPDFPDANASFWAYTYIEYLYSQNIVHGYQDGTYRPDVPVTRDQMAVYVQRAFQYPE